MTLVKNIKDKNLLLLWLKSLYVIADETLSDIIMLSQIIKLLPVREHKYSLDHV